MSSTKTIGQSGLWFFVRWTMSSCFSLFDRADRIMSHSIQVGSSFLDTIKIPHSPTRTRPSPCITRSTYLHNASVKSTFGHLYTMTVPYLPLMESATNLCHLYQAKLSEVEPVDLSSHYPSQGVSWIYVRVKCHQEKLYTTTLSRIPRGSSQRCPSRVILHFNNLGSKSGLSILTLSKLPSNLISTKAVIMHQDQYVLVYPRSPLKQHPVVHIMVLRYIHHHYRH
jgi:hypothetical protein